MRVLKTYWQNWNGSPGGYGLGSPAPFFFVSTQKDFLNRFSTFCIGFRHNPIRKFYNKREIKNFIGAYYQYILLVYRLCPIYKMLFVDALNWEIYIFKGGFLL